MWKTKQKDQPKLFSCQTKDKLKKILIHNVFNDGFFFCIYLKLNTKYETI